MADTNAVGSVFINNLNAKKAGVRTGPAPTPSFSGLLNAIEPKRDVTPPAPVTVTQPSAADTFMDYQTKTIAEKVRASYLSEMGLTEENLNAMSTEDRALVEEKITQKIREQLAKATGGDVREPTLASSGIDALAAGAV